MNSIWLSVNGTGMHDKVKAKLSNSTDGSRRKRRRGRKKYSDNIQRKTIEVKAINLAEGSTRIGFKSYRVQELVLSPLLTEYRREVWRTPCGSRFTAALPEHVKGSHFGADLRRLAVSLYYQGQSTVVRIVDLLNDWDVTFSKRTVMRILNDGMNILVDEAQQVLAAGIAGAQWLHVNDIGSRHLHRNCYCSVIGNDQFTYLATRDRKSRLNFLQVLSGENTQYKINSAAIDYMRKRKLPKITIKLLQNHPTPRFDCDQSLHSVLDESGIVQRKVKPLPLPIITEGALWGALLEDG